MRWASRRRCAAIIAAAMAVGLTADVAVAQPAEAPTPRLSPKNAESVLENAAPTPRPSPKLDAAVPAAPAPEPAEKPQNAVAPQPPVSESAGAAEESSPPARAPEKPAAAAPTPDASRDWRAEAEAALRARLAHRLIEGRARNVVLMIGDGLGVATATAVRLHVNQAAGGLGEETPLPQERFPHSALVKTYTVNAQTGDGAATATALMAGEKTRSGVLGLDQTARRGRCGTGRPLTRIGDLFAAEGRAVGYVTTARITHATPAAGYGRSVERLWEHDGRMPADCLQLDLAQQLIQRMTAGEVALALGGGREAFLPESRKDEEAAPGARRDGRDLLAEARAAGVRTVWSDAGLADLDLSSGAPVLGLFAPGSMAYEHDRVELAEDEPSLAEMTVAALQALEASAEGRGFFLMVEGGRIGQASHFGNLHRAVTDGGAFAAAVAAAAEATDPRETLIIVTADAAHSLAFNGYCGRGSPVPGLCYQIAQDGERHGPAPARDASGAPYETTGFLNGPGVGAPAGAALTDAVARDPNRRQRALVPMETETTSASDVPAYARGPWAHLVDGVVEQHFLFQVMRHAAFQEDADPQPAEQQAEPEGEQQAEPEGEQQTEQETEQETAPEAGATPPAPAAPAAAAAPGEAADP